MMPRPRHVVSRGRDRRYVWLCYRASPMAPRSSTCGRAPMVPRAAERFVVLACVAAQLYMLPRSSTCGRASVLCCHAVLHISAHCYVLPRTHGATRGRTLRPSTCCRAFIHASCLRLCCRVVVWIGIKGQSVPRTMWTIHHHHRHHHPITATTIIIIMCKSTAKTEEGRTPNPGSGNWKILPTSFPQWDF